MGRGFPFQVLVTSMHPEASIPSSQGSADTVVDPLVLVADNDIGVNELLRDVLAKQGIRTEGARDGVTALQRLSEGGVSLLVCDLDMPIMGGKELIAQLETLPQAPAVIVVSGFLDAKTQEELDAVPLVRAVFRKPFDVFAFAARVVEVASGAKSGATDAGGGRRN